MNETTISVPGCSEPLGLEACEVAWLSGHGCSPGDVLNAAWHVADPTDNFVVPVDQKFVVAAYECALRDAVDLWLWEYNARPTLHRNPEGMWTVETTWYGNLRSLGEGPRPLHAWRNAARHLDVGPWTSPEKEMS